MVNVRLLSSGQGQMVDLIRDGRLLPIISGDALEDIVLQGHEALVIHYAQEIGYPLQDRTELDKMIKYRSLSQELKDNAAKTEYLDVVATYLRDLATRSGIPERVITEASAQAAGLKVSDFAKLLGFPHLGEGATNPLEILANLPLPIFVTTTPYMFIEEALRHAGKKPETEFCRWHPGLDSAASVFTSGDYQPNDKRPLVYHLYGLDQYEDSLVLTEDDYLDFLIAVSQSRGKDIDPLHDVVKGALQSKALLLLGFSLVSWSFRVLYRVLIKPMPDSIYQRYCCLQLVPNQDERRYYESYLRKEARFDKVYWKDIEAFCREDLPVEV
ncbi:MAG: SIR2 family protein [Anaerolineae bacterium]|nr:SIR2 family protein [Anaerolineae bacterium]